jgi:hypothetical protein
MKIAVFARCVAHRCNLELQDTQLTHNGTTMINGRAFHQFDITGWVCPEAAKAESDQDKFYINTAGQTVESANGGPKWVCEDTWLMLP